MNDDNSRLQRAQESDRWTVGALKDAVDQRFADTYARIDTLERHMDERFDLQDEATKRALESAEKAVLKAESLASIRAENQNEWRGTTNDFIAALKGESGGRGQVVAWIFGGIGALVGLVSLVTMLIILFAR